MKNIVLIVFCFLSIKVTGQSLDDQLALVYLKYLSAYDLSADHDLTYGSLNDNDYTYYNLTLNSYWTYRLTAVCDGDCSDIDLYLYDENGNIIDDDEEVDDFPIVGCNPKWSGKFKLKVKMVACNINPCRFAIAVFRK